MTLIRSSVPHGRRSGVRFVLENLHEEETVFAPGPERCLEVAVDFPFVRLFGELRVKHLLVERTGLVEVFVCGQRVELVLEFVIRSEEELEHPARHIDCTLQLAARLDLGRIANVEDKHVRCTHFRTRLGWR